MLNMNMGMLFMVQGWIVLIFHKNVLLQHFRLNDNSYGKTAFLYLKTKFIGKIRFQKCFLGYFRLF